MVSGGYPGSYEKGKRISGLEKVDDDVIVFHAGTKRAPHECPSTINDMTAGGTPESMIVTDGGRVLGVTALGDTHEEAREKAYRNVTRISFEGAHYRKDIGLLNRKWTPPNGNNRK